MLAAFTLHVTWLAVYVAPLIPILTAAVVKLRAPGWLKVGITAAFSGAVAIVTTAIQQNSDLILKWEMLGKIALAFGVAMGSYVFLRPTVVATVENATEDKGVG